MPAYTPIAIPNNGALLATDLSDNFSDYREILNTGLEQSNFPNDVIDAERINSSRLIQATGTGWLVLYESGSIETRNTLAADLRAPASFGAWNPVLAPNPGAYSFYDPATSRNINAASRPHNGVIDTGPVCNNSITMYVPRSAYVIITSMHNLGPMTQSGSAAVPNPVGAVPELLTVNLRHRDETGAISDWVANLDYHQPWLTVDRYMRNRTLRLAGVVNPGWHTFFLRAQDPSNTISYTFIGATSFTCEVYYYE